MNGLSLTRRQWCAALAVTMTPGTVTAAPGFHVTGPLTATDTERAERYVNLGKALAVVVNDAALWDQLTPLIGQTVVISVIPDA